MKILITGASQGLGKAIAYKLAKSAHHLVIVARQTEKLAAIQSELSTTAKVDYVTADLSKTDEIAAALVEHTGKNSPDVLINNLGVFQEGTASELKIEDLENQLRLNLYSAVAVSNCMLPFFKERRKGLLINIGSVASHSAVSVAAAYSISKHALKGWNDALREEMRDYGVKVSTIYPSSMNTTSWEGAEDVNQKKMIQKEDVTDLIETLINLGDSTLVEEIRLSPLQNFTVG